MKVLRLLFLFLFLYSCNTPKAVFDYNEKADFSQFRSFDFYPELITGLSPLDENRLLESLEMNLKDKNISASHQPDLYVNVYAEEYQENSRNSLGVGVGGGGGNVGVGVSGGIPLGGSNTYLRLTFDFIDVKNDDLVWQAVVNSKFNKNASPEKRRAAFDKIVKKALEGYPPEN